MGKLKAIIFDVDGTMVDSERYGHMPACNEAMKQIGIDMEWDWEYFKHLIKTIPGSVNRLKSELAKKGFSEMEITDVVSKFEPLKKQIYIEKFLPQLKIKPGVRRILKEAVEKGIILAIISTSYESQIKALLDAQFPEFKSHFKMILGKETGKKTYNDGFLHQMLLQKTQLKPEEILMIEDSSEGMNAALDAGIPTAVIYNDYTFGEDFTNAKLVASSLKAFSIDDLEYLCIEK